MKHFASILHPIGLQYPQSGIPLSTQFKIKGFFSSSCWNSSLSGIFVLYSTCFPPKKILYFAFWNSRLDHKLNENNNSCCNMEFQGSGKQTKYIVVKISEHHVISTNNSLKWISRARQLNNCSLNVGLESKLGENRKNYPRQMTLIWKESQDITNAIMASEP